MPSLIEKNNNAVLQKTIWLMAAVALNAIELAIPKLPFFPWLKPGLANAITVIWIIKYGFTDAILYTALRVWISGFYFGFSLFTFSLGITGGLLSTMIMSVLWMTLGKRKLMGTVGMAIIGALFHNAGQLAVVYFMMSGNIAIFGQIPFMLAASILFGGIVGMLAPAAAKLFDCDRTAIKPCAKKNESPRFAYDGNHFYSPELTAKFIDKTVIMLTFTVSISLMFINNIYILIVAAITFSSISLVLNPQKTSVVFYPIKFYMLFIFIAFTHIFFSYGTYIDTLPFITKEGLFSFINQSLRLWCWLQTAHIFKKFKFSEIFISILNKSFPNKKETIRAGMITLEHFPEIMRFAKPNKKKAITMLLFKPKIFLTNYINDVSHRIEALLLSKHQLNSNFPL
ncbi:MAG: Gx transporter family protein [Chitinispirillales bacterium]|nr:Gx transporter family protein [Chitinispirillales bacterium]